MLKIYPKSHSPVGKTQGLDLVPALGGHSLLRETQGSGLLEVRVECLVLETWVKSTQLLPTL